MADITINDLTEITEVTDSHYLAVDDGTASNKISVENFNATATASAAAYASAAADSATAAAESETKAKGYKETVEQAINDASTIVSNAQTYANAAESSKNDASGYASAASTSASQAATSAGQASSYATGVQAYAIEAKSWAEGGTGTRVDEETTNCEYYANAAHTSEINAATSESNAATSETNAATSERNAAASASGVETNALKAEGYAVGTQDGTPAASGEPYYHDNAKYYKEEAADSASNASSSEYNAGLSESAAAASETAAAGSRDDSEAWAWGKVDGVDVPSTHPAYHNNAKYYADQAGGATSGVSTWNARSGNVVPAAHDYAAGQVDYDNTTSGLTADDVQEAIDEVNSAITGLATVATTGAYSDLSGTPTLGTAAAKDVPTTGNASTTQVVMGDDSRLTDSRTPTSHTHTKSEITDFPSLGTAAAKNSTNAVTQSSTDLVESGAVYSALTWSNVASKPFDYVSTGLTVSNGYMSADVKSVSLRNYSDSSEGFSQLWVNLQDAGMIPGTRYMEQTQTLSTSAQTTYTFTSAAITTTSAIDVYTSIWGVNPDSVSISVSSSAGTCTVVFPAQSSASSMKCRIYIK